MSLYLAFARDIACSIILNDLILLNACKTLSICEDYMGEEYDLNRFAITNWNIYYL